jgi:hypothetical protein
MSTDTPCTWGGPRLPARQSRPAEPLWSMRKDGHQLDAQLRGHGEYGWEVQFLNDGEFYAGRRFNRHAQAVAHGDEIRRDLERKGWLSAVPV